MSNKFFGIKKWVYGDIAVGLIIVLIIVIIVSLIIGLHGLHGRIANEGAETTDSPLPMAAHKRSFEGHTYVAFKNNMLHDPECDKCRKEKTDGE